MIKATTIEQVKAAETAWALGDIDDVAIEIGWSAAEYQAYQATGQIPMVVVSVDAEPEVEQVVRDAFDAANQIPCTPHSVAGKSEANPFLAGVDQTLLAGTQWKNGSMVEVVANPTPPNSGPRPPRLHPDEVELMSPAVYAEAIGVADTVRNAQAQPDPAWREGSKELIAWRRARNDENRVKSEAWLAEHGITPGTEVSVWWNNHNEGQKEVRHTGTVKSIDAWLHIEPCTTTNNKLRLNLCAFDAIQRIERADTTPTTENE